MSKAKLPLRIYILIVLFLCHLLSVTYESDLYGNIFSPIVAFYSSYVIYSSVKKRAQKETDLTWYFLFAFTFLWGIIDTLWLIYDSFLSIDVNDTLIPSLYTFPSIILAGLVLYVFGRVHKKWNKFQLLTDITGIGIILMILIWSFIFSKTSMRYESSFDFINTTVYMLSDFIVLASYIVFYFSARKKKTPISFNTVFGGILIYTFTDFYYAYLDLTGMYNANTLIDSSYTLTCTLFAVGAYFRSIRPIKAQSTDKSYETLPYNYGNSKKFQILVILPILVLLYPFIGWHNFLIILIIIGVHQLTSRYIQVSIKTDYLLKKEQHINEYLEQAIQEKISDLKLANKALKEISNKDGLTGLYNRRYFLNNLDELINDTSCSKFALLYMDMDRFKAINDTHGHEVGDQVLYSLSKRFANHCKDNCTVYRVGGDEFAVIIKDYEDTSYLYDIIDSLLKISESPIRIPPYVFNVSLSIGVAKYPKDAKDKGTLLKYADIAMYEAKITHTNQKYFFFDSDLSEKVQKKHSLEVMLKNSNFDNEFKLYYQPQYRTSDNKLVGMEALLR